MFVPPVKGRPGLAAKIRNVRQVLNSKNGTGRE